MAIEVSDWVPAGSSPSSRQTGSVLQSGSPSSSSSLSVGTGLTPGGWSAPLAEAAALEAARVARADPGTGFA